MARVKADENTAGAFHLPLEPVAFSINRPPSMTRKGKTHVPNVYEATVVLPPEPYTGTCPRGVGPV